LFRHKNGIGRMDGFAIATSRVTFSGHVNDRTKYAEDHVAYTNK